MEKQNEITNENSKANHYFTMKTLLLEDKNREHLNELSRKC